MDDVMLEDRSAVESTLGLSGKAAAALLEGLGVTLPLHTAAATIQIATVEVQGIPLMLSASRGAYAPQYALACAAEHIGTLWHMLVNAGAAPCGLAAVESLRILEGLPRYGQDLGERDLPQESSQARALNFNKGCYLGQEIVERIRSRGAVHRALVQFKLRGELPELPAELMAGDKSIGRLTSAVALATPAGRQLFALGIVRSDAVSRGEALTYNGGEATVLQQPPPATEF